MAYSEELAKRIRPALAHRTDVEEKKMFGGLAFMVNGKMAVGIIKDQLMIRVVPNKYETLLEMPHTKPMDFTGRIMKGFVQIEESGLETEAQLQQWVETGIEFADLVEVKKPKHKKAV
ncbi:MAG: hypothetical protein GC192_21975 [Bacteroidetes bacterium]|nr:hypothetical protein [Bacteroidota bacterium]